MKLRPATLTGKQVRHLRSLGHALKPLIRVGKAGISEQFIKQVRKTIEDHELIKVKLICSAPSDINQTAQELKSKVPCHLVQKIGKTILLFNQRGKEPEIVLPKIKPNPHQLKRDNKSPAG